MNNDKTKIQIQNLTMAYGSYVVMRDINAAVKRGSVFVVMGFIGQLPLWLVVTLATAWLRPETFTNLLARPWSWGVVVLMLGGIGGVFHFPRRGRDLAAFLSSAAFLLGLLAGTLAGTYPVWLRSTIDPAYSLTAQNSAAQSYGLQVALVWWTASMALAGAYFANLFRSTRGKVDVRTDGHDYH